uniref:Uncharacterized protein n=1 Tax=Anguilla anguilla TaxID=7936 RepID=A0A0E9XXU1_ANGAN
MMALPEVLKFIVRYVFGTNNLINLGKRACLLKLWRFNIR